MLRMNMRAAPVLAFFPFTLDTITSFSCVEIKQMPAERTQRNEYSSPYREPCDRQAHTTSCEPRLNIDTLVQMLLWTISKYDYALIFHLSYIGLFNLLSSSLARWCIAKANVSWYPVLDHLVEMLFLSWR